FPEDTAIQKALDGFLGEDKVTEQNIDYVEVVGEHHDPRISIENARIVVKDQSIKMSDLVKARKDRAIIEEGARRSLIRLALETARGAKLLGVEATDVPDIITSYYQRVSEFRDTR